MSKKFASIELARIYETQGYFQDALSMYNSLDADILKGGAEIRAAVKRLEIALAKEGANGALDTASGQLSEEAGRVVQTLAELNGFETEDSDTSVLSRSGPEQKMADLLEKWLMLVVARKRLGLFKQIKTRL